MLLVLWKKWFSPAPVSDSLPQSGEPPEQRVAAIQAGDEALRETFIAQYRPFIIKTTSRVCKRPIHLDRDDEFSVALAAFDEAINRYSADGGSSFLGFAHTVITRRLIDYARQEKRHAVSVPYSSLANDEEGQDELLQRIESSAAVEVYEQRLAAEDRREEIAALSEQMALFGIRWTDLVDQSPQHRDSRETLLLIGKRLAQSEELLRTMLDKKQLPVKEICIKEGVSRKTVERHRKYLIAVTLIAAGPYPFLREYINIPGIGEEGEKP